MAVIDTTRLLPTELSGAIFHDQTQLRLSTVRNVVLGTTRVVSWDESVATTNTSLTSQLTGLGEVLSQLAYNEAENIYLCTSAPVDSNKAFRSTDGGVTWTQLASTAPFNGDTPSICATPTKFFAKLNGSETFYNSTDGVTWSAGGVSVPAISAGYSFERGWLYRFQGKMVYLRWIFRTDGDPEFVPRFWQLYSFNSEFGGSATLVDSAGSYDGSPFRGDGQTPSLHRTTFGQLGYNPSYYLPIGYVTMVGGHRMRMIRGDISTQSIIPFTEVVWPGDAYFINASYIDRNEVIYVTEDNVSPRTEIFLTDGGLSLESVSFTGHVIDDSMDLVIACGVVDGYLYCTGINSGTSAGATYIETAGFIDPYPDAPTFDTDGSDPGFAVSLRQGPINRVMNGNVLRLQVALEHLLDRTSESDSNPQLVIDLNGYALTNLSASVEDNAPARMP